MIGNKSMYNIVAASDEVARNIAFEWMPCKFDGAFGYCAPFDSRKNTIVFMRTDGKFRIYPKMFDEKVSRRDLKRVLKRLYKYGIIRFEPIFEDPFAEFGAPTDIVNFDHDAPYLEMGWQNLEKIPK